MCQRYKLCEFLWFVWTDCRGNKSYYVITSSANLEAGPAYLCSLCSSSWQSLHVNLSQVSQYSFSGSCGCTLQKNCFLSLRVLSFWAPSAVDASISSLGRITWSLVTLTLWCAFTQSSQSHSWQSWHHDDTVALSSQLVHTLLSFVVVASVVTGVELVVMKLLSIISSRLRHSWRQIGHLAAVGGKKDYVI